MIALEFIASRLSLPGLGPVVAVVLIKDGALSTDTYSM
jgi:hypothetical protein